MRFAILVLAFFLCSCQNSDDKFYKYTSKNCSVSIAVECDQTCRENILKRNDVNFEGETVTITCNIQ